VSLGFDDWCHLSRAINSHEVSKAHIEACQVYKLWELHGTIHEVNEADIRRQANYWTQVLDRIVNVTITLACNNITFRGHREYNNTELNGGTFLTVIDILAKYDPELEQFLEKPKGNITYLSPTIQNEIIALLAESIKSEIVVELKETLFFSIFHNGHYRGC
jgi:hypothetical protein